MSGMYDMKPVRLSKRSSYVKFNDDMEQAMSSPRHLDMLRAPIVGQFAYNLLTSRRAIQNYYDIQGYHNPGLITDELVEYIFSSAHQSNARFAAASALTGNLTTDAHEPLARLQMPVVIVLGREGALTPSEASAAFKRVNSRIETRTLDNASQQPQDEQAAKFNALVREFAGVTVTH